MNPPPRNALLGGAAGLVALAVLGGVLLAQGGDDGGAEQLAAPAPTTTAPTSTASAAISVPTTTAPTAAASRPTTTSPPSSRAPRPSATTKPAERRPGQQRPCPDGVPGWDEGIGADGTDDVCRYLDPDDVDGARQVTLRPGLVLSIEQARRASALRGGAAMDLVIRNTTPRSLTLVMNGTETGYGVAGATYGFPDDVQVEQETVAAGQTGRLALPDTSMQTCGDTSRQGRTPLPSGTYTYSWTNTVAVSSEPVATEPPDPSVSAAPTATASPDPDAWRGQRVDLVGSVTVRR